MNFNTFLKLVNTIKALPLLGEVSHAKLSPPYRLELAKQVKAKAQSAKKAAVLALFYPDKTAVTHVALILRKAYKGVHSAQVSFPGGKAEVSDEDYIHTALRETEEEIGVTVSRVAVLKTLSPLYIPPSNFLVHPFIAVSKSIPRFTKQIDEVEAIIEVPLEEILNDNTIVSTLVNTSYNVTVEVPAFQFSDHIVWGATAMMLSEIKDLLKQVLA